MAIILKEGGVFTPSSAVSMGVEVVCTTYYGVIDNIVYNKAEKDLTFTVVIYSSEAYRKAGRHAVDFVHINLHHDAFDQKVGSNGLSIAAAYALALQDTRLGGFESDEE